MDSNFTVAMRKLTRKAKEENLTFDDACKEENADLFKRELMQDVERTITQQKEIGRKQLISNYNELEKDYKYAQSSILNFLYGLAKQNPTRYDREYPIRIEVLHIYQDALIELGRLAVTYFSEIYAFDEKLPQLILRKKAMTLEQILSNPLDGIVTAYEINRCIEKNKTWLNAPKIGKLLHRLKDCQMRYVVAQNSFENPTHVNEQIQRLVDEIRELIPKTKAIETQKFAPNYQHSDIEKIVNECFKPYEHIVNMSFKVGLLKDFTDHLEMVYQMKEVHTIEELEGFNNKVLEGGKVIFMTALDPQIVYFNSDKISEEEKRNRGLFQGKVTVQVMKYINEHLNYQLKDSERNLENTNVSFCCNLTEEIIRGALKFGMSQNDYEVFTDTFNLHYITGFGGSIFENKNLPDEIDIPKLITEIFNRVELIEDERLKSYFLDQIYLDIQNQNEGWGITLVKFNKQFKDKRKAWEIGEVKNELVQNVELPSNYSTRVWALFYFYQQEAGLMDYFENMEGGKVKSIKKLVSENLHLGSWKHFQNHYNEISKSVNRLNESNHQNIRDAITLLAEYPKAKNKAEKELNSIIK